VRKEINRMTRRSKEAAIHISPSRVQDQLAQSYQRSITMRTDEEADASSSRRSATTREELKIVCKKIADVDALWRMNPFHESPIEKRAA
jgi:hypothetical protein